MRFKKGDNKGIKNKNWKGGKCVKSEYVTVLSHGHRRADKNGRVKEHFLIAEKALGKSIMLPTCVHHINENKHDNKASNLVICQDRAYHNLLHIRKKALNESGNVNHRKCSYCHKYDAVESMYYHKSCRSYHHNKCENRYQRERRTDGQLSKNMAALVGGGAGG